MNKKDWEKMNRDEKNQAIMNWMLTDEYTSHMKELEDNILENKEWDKVRDVVKKLADITKDMIEDRDTGLIKGNIYIIALIKALISTHIAKEDFLRSGR